MKKILLTTIAAAALAVGSNAYALLASDDAANYGAGWTNNANGGTGFLAWSFSSNDNPPTIYAGAFTGNSTAGAGNINTSGVSFGLYANPAAGYFNADRGFASGLASGDVFSLQLALNYDNGNKGINLFAGAQGQIFNFNVGGGAGVSSANATLTPGLGAGYNYGGSDAVLNLSFTMTSASQLSYLISRTSSQGFQGTLFSGTVSGLAEAPSGFRLYNSGTDNGDNQNNLYANSLSVVPEPSTYALLGISAIGMAGYMIRRRRR